MRAGSKFIIGFITAAVTFATLMAFAEPLALSQRDNHCWYNKTGNEPGDTTKTDY
jgi:hypothetical protein